MTMSGENGTVALVFQGGGALGAYQAGVYEALAKAGHEPDWTAGISIGAINAAIIAGNAPGQRVERLRAFWDLVSSRVTVPSLFPEGFMRSWFNEISAEGCRRDRHSRLLRATNAARRAFVAGNTRSDQLL